MSEYLLSAELHTQSFSTSAKFCKEWLQNDNLAEIETHKCHKISSNTANEVKTVPSGVMRQETKHPYFLRSRHNSMLQNDHVAALNVSPGLQNSDLTEIHSGRNLIQVQFMKFRHLSSFLFPLHNSENT